MAIVSLETFDPAQWARIVALAPWPNDARIVDRYGVTWIKVRGTGAAGGDWTPLDDLSDPGGDTGASVADDTAYDRTTWDGDTTHAPSKNAVRDKIDSMMPQWRAGKYYGPPLYSTASLALAAQQLYLVPWRDHPVCAVDRLAVRVVTGVGSAKCRVVVYADNGGIPDGGALIADSGDLDCSVSTTSPEATVAVTIPAGLVWVGVIAQGTAPTVAGRPVASGTLTGGGPYDAPSGGGPVRTAASVATGAAPATCPVTTNPDGVMPMIWVRANP